MLKFYISGGDFVLCGGLAGGGGVVALFRLKNKRKNKFCQ